MVRGGGRVYVPLPRRSPRTPRGSVSARRPVPHPPRRFLGDDDDAGLVADDPIPRAHDLAAALDLGADLPVALWLSRVRGKMAAEAREGDLPDRVNVPRRPIDHDARDASHLARPRRELAPHRRGAAAGVHDDHRAPPPAVDRPPPPP